MNPAILLISVEIRKILGDPGVDIGVEDEDEDEKKFDVLLLVEFFLPPF